MDNACRLLKDVFGFDSFKLAQEAVISRLLIDNENALVIFPTGGGKSLTYQIPALCLDGLTLVISPLIALMKDQVDALVSRGVKAARLDSTQEQEQANWVKQEVLSGALKILYVAPERLNNERFLNMMSQVPIALLAVDEAHCISQWGASFRPEYLKIARFAIEQDVQRVLCLTATATLVVANDICKSFLITPEGVFRTPVYRPNLSLRVATANSFNDKLARLVPLLRNRTGPCIVYVTLQKHAEDVASALRPHGLEAAVYHAGLPNEQRALVQNSFMKSEMGIVVCTIAFGMGIDKSNIRQVIHLYMPKTLENYSQEVGRAGRDGLASECAMFLCPQDIPILEGFCRGDTCSERDLQLWLQEVFLKPPSADGTIDFALYKQQKEYDIRQNVLNLCYAQLELDYGYIRATTPFYSVYSIAPLNQTWANLVSCKSKVVTAIRSYSRPKGAKYEIDVTDAASATGVDRSEITKQLNDWDFGGQVEVKASLVRSRYVVLKQLPKSADEIKRVAGEMHARMIKREEEGIQKLREVIQFATNDDCLMHNLVKYFGNEDAVPDGMCQRCTFCMTGQSTEFSSAVTTVVDLLKVQAILNACPERDDPRLLARMAFGITSPRLTLGKWSTAHPLFGSMYDTDFNALIAVFEAECRKCEYQRATVAIEGKRSYSTDAENSGYRGSGSSGGNYLKGGHSGGARRGSKRARLY